MTKRNLIKEAQKIINGTSGLSKATVYRQGRGYGISPVTDCLSENFGESFVSVIKHLGYTKFTQKEVEAYIFEYSYIFEH